MRLLPNSKLTVASILLGVWISLPVGAPLAAQSLDELFGQLAEAAPDEAARIASQIETEWTKSGSASIDLLLARGNEAMEAGDFAMAAQHYSAAIDHAPDFPEPYFGRAAAFWLTNYAGPALDDLAQVLAREPRHYQAMALFGVILEDIGKPQEALDVYRRALALHPHASDIADRAAALEKTLEGRTL